MLHTIIQKNSYQDSIVLMLLTNRLNTLTGVTKASVMMGTPANKDIFKTGGLYTSELEEASSNDMAIVLEIDGKDEQLIQDVLNTIDEFLAEQSKGGSDKGTETVKTWDKALELGEDAHVVIFSIPGTHAALEIEHALNEGKHVFCFSDNVALEDEVRLKQMAHEKGLLLMGPDCGTGIINGIPVAFTNAVRKGSIGVVGASGTGIQEVTTLIHKLGGGVTNAIGTGGRDLKDEVGGITLKDSVATLENDPDTKVIVVISKPPAPSVRDEVLDLLRSSSKPVVTIFLGEEPTDHEENLYRAYTLEEAAEIAVQLMHGKEVVEKNTALEDPCYQFAAGQTGIKGLYSGGTLAYEAAMLMKRALGLKDEKEAEAGFILKDGVHEIIDLGDDIYTQGKPHPMIDPSKRQEMLAQAADDPTTAVILLDDVLGYGSHENMAKELAPTIKEIKEKAASAGRELVVIATIVGTDEDPQNMADQKRILTEAGTILCNSNAQAVKLALIILGHPLTLPERKVLPKKSSGKAKATPSKEMMRLLTNDAFINIGLRSFSDAITSHNGKAVQFDWQPVAGGNITLQKALQFLNKAELN
ncbi:acyl-CoA synthetase FdrA [Enterococcus hulanensis]|uniref:Acyl-CoA synthetase FdrA n=1 Tax=Enterococcus hulanensis TaxID=2559929 RepID=A0ABU3ETH0_9ENTE|nr:acyl-CoA synthetase FdrA [Enterococcus hulanensis]MDT2598162.1 acyl-CoA synthetase FdrA [Enterococcus hulanensis]MDT2608333.1 acyl-CoA synthetase FdrA [Enterococcus hulanensis]MDT2615628.1 acyl-CoA synthetase FdrA [Enterococcus hulanensis]MDT2626401.1 acyl-CoA synthetase FdrA [Enterococcus hulanensis]MDT2654700.1 acyl-CoA synthetase FdrA [Enterococcus hulanensis]